VTIVPDAARIAWDLSGISDLTTFEAAFVLAGRGVPIWLLSAHKKVPVIPKADGGSGLNDATTDPETLERWFDRYGRGCNIATPTGLQASGWQLIVLDVDLPPNHEDGRIVLNRLRSEGLELSPTLTATTGSGGKHYYYWTQETRKPLNSARLGWKGIDILGQGQSVILPPSKFDGGQGYRFDND